ncbi:MAG: hypothetical protein CMI98_01680 [Pelagibacteraceae bacterium]|nr:hypothetical protein [Pelagibacteraceae bacterium]|tara:strand:+ start:123 stop:611 length:489 start_codon:yes stop_codon:yes gene_type:complete
MIGYLLSDAKFWTAVAFVIFILVTYRPVKKILLKALDEKITSIKNKINDAKKIREDAYSLLGEIKVKKDNIKKEIDEIKKVSENKMKMNLEEMQKKLENQLNRKKNLVEIKIKQIEQEAINEINYKTTFYTIQTLKKIINIKINDIIHQELIDSALSDFNKN